MGDVVFVIWTFMLRIDSYGGLGSTAGLQELWICIWGECNRAVEIGEDDGLPFEPFGFVARVELEVSG